MNKTPSYQYLENLKKKKTLVVREIFFLFLEFKYNGWILKKKQIFLYETKMRGILINLRLEKKFNFN
jgi:hypothetical protein